MGEIADLYIDQMLCREFLELEDTYRGTAVRRPTTWKTKDGSVLKIVDMDTSHIRNCIKLLADNGYEDSLIMQEMRYELKKRPETGQFTLSLDLIL